MRAVFQLILLGALSTPAGAQSLEVLGYAGELGEWELTATVTRKASDREFSGQLMMKHIGICTQDGPEEKSGEIRLQYRNHPPECPRHYRLTASNVRTPANFRMPIRELCAVLTDARSR